MFKIRKLRNNVIKEKMNIKNSVLDYIRYKQLNWYGHVQRIDEERLKKSRACRQNGRSYERL